METNLSWGSSYKCWGKIVSGNRLGRKPISVLLPPLVFLHPLPHELEKKEGGPKEMWGGRAGLSWYSGTEGRVRHSMGEN